VLAAGLAPAVHAVRGNVLGGLHQGARGRPAIWHWCYVVPALRSSSSNSTTAAAFCVAL
jgi:hypothetical protein